ncbi:transglycosylase family protein [Isoptericola sp. 4D.3]|uniref:Transglycosylase family protein n=1 Tax=Isoptericola peretonis TaxID=2918523 RepID=A0ABT0J5U5_9MICO|nr:transglycosylase family protein [Isoptericola sp. 4D.3]
MAGSHDDWTCVNSSNETPNPAADPAPEASGTATTTATRRRRLPLIAGLAAGALVLAGGAATAYETARKSVTLDVDGETKTVETFSGSVAGLLDAQGVEVDGRDAVTPGTDAALRDGSQVVVRYGHELTVDVDGEQDDVWVTALDAEEALRGLDARGSDVALIASRSGDRASLPLRLDADQPVAVVADGTTTVVDDGSVGLEAILQGLGLSADKDDRVFVERQAAKAEGDPAVRIVIERVDTKKVTKKVAVDHKSRTEKDADRYADLGSKVAQEGKDGERTLTYRVTTVDGDVVAKKKLSDKVTTKPVTEVVVEGTKERPEPEPEPAPKEESSDSSSSDSSADSSSGSSDGGSSAGGSAPAGVWAQLAECESGGDPTTNTGNGYYGLYQFSAQTWQAMGGSGLPSENSAAEQTRLAQKLQAQSGWGQWPACAAKLGLL